MLNITDFSFLSSDGTTQLHAMEWQDTDRAPIAVLQITHGVAEYIARYDDFARFLVENGFAVVGHDHLGHGKSLGEGGTSVFFSEENGWQKAVDDVYGLHCIIKEKYPGIPCFLMGHSMGSFIARSFLIRYPGAVDGAIIMGTGWQSPVILTGGLLVAAWECRRRGCRATSDLVTSLAFGSYNKAFAPNRTASDWLSVNAENVDRYIADPLCGQDATVGLFRDMLRGFRFNQNAENLRKMDPDTPVFFIAGQDDPVGEMGKGVARSAKAFRDAGMKHVEELLFPGLRHEILNETCREDVYHRLLQWLKQYM